MRSIIDIYDITTNEISELIKTAIKIIEDPAAYMEKCRGKILANLFFEPSTRTRMSMESAMYSLGGNVINMNNPASSSISKGETLSDTIKVVSNYADIISIRHPLEGAALAASRSAAVPVINAGDGGHAHPTQTLADLLTIYREKGHITDMTVGFCGDLKYGRTVHSLINALLRYEGIKFVLISPYELRLPDYVKRVITEKQAALFETDSLDDAIKDLDVLYMTRIQKERFPDANDYRRLKGSYILDKTSLDGAKNDLTVMHPLPRVDEISSAIDADRRACYFKQVANGKYMRMALIMKLLSTDWQSRETNADSTLEQSINEFECSNPRCITGSETNLERIFERTEGSVSDWKCLYCESAPIKK